MVMPQQPPSSPLPPPSVPSPEPSLVAASQPQRSQSSSVVAGVLIGLIGLVVVAGLVIVVAGNRLFGDVVEPVATAPAAAPTSAGAGAGGAGGANSGTPVAAPAGQPTSAVTIDGAALAAMPDDVAVIGADDPAAGALGPTLTGTDFDGNPVTIGADGRAKVIYFLAHWCSHCQAEVPIIQDLIDSGQKPANIDVYAVSTAVAPERGNYPPDRWLEEAGFTPVTMRDDAASSALVAYGGGGFPYAVYLDSQNRVIARSAGELGQEGIAQMWAATASAG